MLSESFVASTLASAKTPVSASLKDVGICLHEFQPSSTLRSTFKKSSTAPNCLAVSVSHVFAAQSEKAIVHVYSREKGNQEATVPFPERIRSIAVAGSKNGDIVVLGTEGGRLILWEVCESNRFCMNRTDGIQQRFAPGAKLLPRRRIYALLPPWWSIPARTSSSPVRRMPASMFGH